MEVGAAMKKALVLLLAVSLLPILALSQDKNKSPDAWLLSQQEPNWTRKNPANSPSARRSHAMAYDAARGQVVLFGGDYGSSFLGDTWVWDGTNWTQKNPANSPSARDCANAMAYDVVRGQVVLYGGWNGGAGGYLGDTWVWDGTNWNQKSPANSPGARNAHALAYDAARGQVVLFGGYCAPNLFSDTWIWDGTNWTQKSPGIHPTERNLHAMAYDAAAGQVVLFGGYGNRFFGDTWVWDGMNWMQKSPANIPAERYRHAMAYDEAREQVVLFGGLRDSFFGDTWIWDGMDWTKKSPAHSPSARDYHAMVYDAARGQVVLFAGQGQLSKRHVGLVRHSYPDNDDDTADIRNSSRRFGCSG